MEKKNKREQKHWTEEQNIYYDLFVLLHEQEFCDPQEGGKKKRLFKKMSKWMGDKTPGQCCNHHKKRMRGKSI